MSERKDGSEKIGNSRESRICHIGTPRYKKLTEIALAVSSETGVILSASAVAKYLIDNFADQVKKQIIEHLKREKV